MKHTKYFMCNLYRIQDNFSIYDNKSIGYSIINSKKNLLRTIIASFESGKITEFLTGVEFDYSNIEVFEKYSKLLRKKVIKKNIKLSTEPIHVGLIYKDLSIPYITETNYEYANDDDIREYYHDVIIEFDTIDNYKRYLLTLKQNANDKLDDAIKEQGRSKRISLTRKG